MSKKTNNSTTNNSTTNNSTTNTTNTTNTAQVVPKSTAKNASIKSSTKNAATPQHRNYVSEALAKEVLNKMHDSNGSPLPHVRDVQSILEAFVHLLVQRTMDGETTTVTNFATFSRRYVKERMHTNPQNKDPVPKPEHYKMHVDVKPALKEKLEAIAIVTADRK
jgi:nucleoid DNA-binding protein